jgi:hypothetical protein
MRPSTITQAGETTTLPTETAKEAVKIPVFIVKTSSRANNSAIIARLFSEPLFIVMEQRELPPTASILDILKVWDECSTTSKRSYAILIADTSISYLSPETIRDRVLVAITKAPEADIHYLCKWKDDCAKYSSVADSSTMKWSSSPHGLQAVLVPAKTRDVILRKTRMTDGSFFDVEDIAACLTRAIRENILKATVFVPNIIDFDINYASSNSDYERLNQCREEPKRRSMNWKWAILIVLFILLVIVVICCVVGRRQ